MPFVPIGPVDLEASSMRPPRPPRPPGPPGAVPPRPPRRSGKSMGKGKPSARSGSNPANLIFGDSIPAILDGSFLDGQIFFGKKNMSQVEKKHQ